MLLPFKIDCFYLKGYNINMNQLEIRNKIKLLRNNLTAYEVKTLSEAVTKTVLNFDFLQEKSVFFIYNSIKNEVDTADIQNYLKVNNKTLTYPVVTDNGMVAAFPLSSETIKGAFGVTEPKEYKIFNEIDVCFVPLVACDLSKNRIGFGKGYYDRFLQKTPCLKIGLCYDFQVVDKIKPNEFDVPLDIIVTPTKIIK